MSYCRRKLVVFISYQRSDQEAARRAFHGLKGKGMAPWMDLECLAGGDQWETTIDQKIRESDLVIVLLSKHSFTRDGFLQQEIHTALEVCKRKAPGKTFLIPVQLEDCPIHPRMKGLHHVKLYEPGGWERLMDELRVKSKALNAPAPKASTSTAAGLSASPRPGNVLPRVPVRPKASVSALTIRTNPSAVDSDIPFAIFPGDIDLFLHGSDFASDWNKLDDVSKKFVQTIGCKFEPIVQIVPSTPVPDVLAFECLAVSADGHSFKTIVDRCRFMQPGALRLCMAVAALETVSKLKIDATPRNPAATRRIKFSLNLDSHMLDSPALPRLIERYADLFENNVYFELNEQTTMKHLHQIKTLQRDYNLRYAADDLNRWDASLRVALMPHVDLTKMDYEAFKNAMDMRGDEPKEAIGLLRANKLRHKPLVVEGIEDPGYIPFLERHWKPKVHGELYGQGFLLNPGYHWQSYLFPLRDYGLPGGNALRKQA